MADRIDKVTRQNTVDADGRQVVTRAVSSESRDDSVNKVAQIVWFIVGVLVALLLARVVLSLLGANEANDFASFIYEVTGLFVAPFRGLLMIGEFQSGVSRFEIETLVAAVVYILLGWGITAGINLAKKNPEA